MRTWLLVILLSAPALQGCIPIGVRAGTMPYASLSQPTVAVMANLHRCARAASAV